MHSLFDEGKIDHNFPLSVFALHQSTDFIFLSTIVSS